MELIGKRKQPPAACRHKSVQSKQETLHANPPKVIRIIEFCPECNAKWVYEPCGECGSFIMRKEDRYEPGDPTNLH